MVFFDTLFAHFSEDNKAAPGFKVFYHILYDFASILSEELKLLKSRQKKLALKIKEKGQHFGGLRISKSQVIDEALIPELEKLADAAIKRFEEAKNVQNELIRPSADEFAELFRVKSILDKISQTMTNLRNLERTIDANSEYLMIDSCLTNINEVLQKIHAERRYGLAKKALRDAKKFKLVKTVFRGSRPYYICPSGHNIDQKHPAKKCVISLPSIIIIDEFELKPKQLKELQSEADFINSHNDPRNQLHWRRWWRENQVPEADVSTGYRKEHINVMIKLNGKKKNIHLVVN